MIITTKIKRNMKKVLIIGMGEFGKHVAYTLAKLKNEVCIIDTNSDIINICNV